MQLRPVMREGPQGVPDAAALPADFPGTIGVTIFLNPRFTMMTAACIIDTLRIANRVAGRPVYRWTVVAPTQTALSSGGVGVNIETDFRAIDRTGIAIVCGGLGNYVGDDHEIQAWLRRLHNRGALVIAISTGVWTVARAGLLDRRSCAVHWDEVPSFSARFPAVRISRDIFVADGRIITCSGGSATLDMMLHVVNGQFGPVFADKIADLLIHSRPRPASEPQRRVELQEDTRVNIVKQAIALMEHNIERVLTIDAICRKLGYSRRKLERKFLLRLGVTPKQHYLEIRLQTASKLLLETDIGVTQVSMMCGYQSSSQFTKEFKRRYLLPPLAYRKKYSLIF